MKCSYNSISEILRLKYLLDGFFRCDVKCTQKLFDFSTFLVTHLEVEFLSGWGLVGKNKTYKRKELTGYGNN